MKTTGFKKGYIPWNKGLTKEMHPSMAKIADAQVGRTGFWAGKKRPGMKTAHLAPYWKGEGNIFSKIKFEGEGHANWKGDKAGYIPKHLWIQRQKGKPTKCENCDRDGLKGKQIHWANKDHKYRRGLEDWLRLCAKCHHAYDVKFNGRKLSGGLNK